MTPGHLFIGFLIKFFLLILFLFFIPYRSYIFFLFFLFACLLENRPDITVRVVWLCVSSLFLVVVVILLFFVVVVAVCFVGLFFCFCF